MARIPAWRPRGEKSAHRGAAYRYGFCWTMRADSFAEPWRQPSSRAPSSEHKRRALDASRPLDLCTAEADERGFFFRVGQVMVRRMDVRKKRADAAVGDAS